MNMPMFIPLWRCFTFTTFGKGRIVFLKYLVVSFLAVTVSVVSMYGALAQAKTILVCPNGCLYSSINSAVNEAGPDDKVLVFDGEYVEDFVFPAKAVSIESVNGPAVTTIVCKDKINAAPTNKNAAKHSVVAGFTIKNAALVSSMGNSYGLAATIINCVINDEFIAYKPVFSFAYADGDPKKDDIWSFSTQIR